MRFADVLVRLDELVSLRPGALAALDRWGLGPPLPRRDEAHWLGGMRLFAPILLASLLPSIGLAQTNTATEAITAPGGPLTEIFLGVDGSSQIAHLLDANDYQVYPSDGVPGDYGTLVLVAGTSLYAPDFQNHASGSATDSIGEVTLYTPISQTGVLGAGTALDPFRITTVLGLGQTGLEIAQTDAYVVGEESFLTTVRLSNTGTTAREIVLYRAADCFLGGAGLSWSFALAPGASTSRIHLTTFSPVGNVPVVTLKTADVGAVAIGGTTGYTLVFDNANVFAVTLDQVVDLLPPGFSYLPGSTSGRLNGDPAIQGSALTWTGPLVVPGQGTAMMHFGVRIATSTGTYFNNATAVTSDLVAIAPTGDTAPVQVVSGTPGDDGGLPTDGASQDAERPDGYDPIFDGGSVDGSGVDAGGNGSDSGSGGSTDPNDGDGCSCRSVPGAGATSAWTVLALLGLGWRRRRGR